jgi:catechol 2,3-dioxygenase-like lactoylglutathione lyase family enzyme
MPAQLDHLILAVNDVQKSLDFYTGVLGFTHEGDRPPFSTVRVTPDLVLQLAPWGTRGGEHLAFAMAPDEFEEVFRRLRDAGIAYGDSFDSAANMRGPGQADGARGATRSLYVFDPSEHLIEIIYYP